MPTPDTLWTLPKFITKFKNPYIKFTVARLTVNLDAVVKKMRECYMVRKSLWQRLESNRYLPISKPTRHNS